MKPKSQHSVSLLKEGGPWRDSSPLPTNGSRPSFPPGRAPPITPPWLSKEPVAIQSITEMSRIRLLPLFLLVAIVSAPSPLHAVEAKPAAVFSDHAVLQRDIPVPVWGTAEPSQPVSVSFAEQTKRATADANGRWSVTFDPMPASAEPRDLTISSESANSGEPPLKFKDVLVGDVWLCAGPGGAWERTTERLAKVASSEIAKASHPLVRLMRPVVYGSILPVDDMDPSTRWVGVTPQNIGAFPVTWYFARELQQTTGVPVGLIQVHSAFERLGEWQAWKLDPKNTRQNQTLQAVAQRLPEDIAAAERWLTEIEAWKPGQSLNHGFPYPAYLQPDVQAPHPLSTTLSAAYNFNVAPLAGMSLRGVLFFSEIARASVGSADFVNLVSSWRDAWGRPELPFLLLPPSQPQATSARVEEALTKASELSRVRVIPRTAKVDVMGTNDALWREVAAAARDVPALSGADYSTVRKWAPAAPLEVAGHRAPLEVACIFGENMVLQAGMPVPIWGWAKPGSAIHVSFAGQTVDGVANRVGEWRVVLAPMAKSSTPLEMRINGQCEGEAEDLRFGNALVGEVWSNSGQSNAGRVLAATLGFEQEKPHCNFPEIRYFRVSGGDSAFPARRARGTWVVLTPESAGMMPGQGYYFSKQIHQQLGTPVGLVNSSAGGSTIFSWMSQEALESSPKLQPLLSDFLKHRNARVARLPVFKRLVRQWVEEARRNGTAARAMPFYPIDGLILNPIEARGGLLYNSMLHPILGLTMRGMLWNQGEADTGAGIRSDSYTELMESMVTDWRKSWGYEFPFYFVQMPAVKARSGLTQMWEAQTRAMNRIPKSGMIVCNDISDGDIHPADKKNVGERLARLALVRTYGVKSILDSSPFWKKVERDGHRVVVTFSPVGDGLQTRDGKSPDSWEIAGADGKFVVATALISGDRVVVSAPSVDVPERVRLGWNGESNCNLVNSAGLPAMPFSAVVSP
jgi:hypothetical protein